MYIEPDYGTVNLHTYYFVIKVLDAQRKCVVWHKWTDLPWEVRMKWNWYFKYRAARYQVQYPRYEVETHWGACRLPNADFLDWKNKVRAKKGKITEYTNKIALVEKQWNSLFPLEKEPKYQQALAKLARLKIELAELLDAEPAAIPTES